MTETENSAGTEDKDRIVYLDDVSYRSVSQLTSYIGCGEAYRLERIAKAPRKPAAWLIQGTAFHGAVEFWEREDRKPESDQVLEVFENIWDEEQAADMDIDYDKWLTGTPKRNGEADIELRRAKGTQQVLDYIEFANANKDEWRILTLNGEKMLEKRFELIINLESAFTAPIRVIGYIDHMVEYRNGAIRPRDLKSGTKRPEWEIQLGVYALAMREEYAIDGCWHGDFYMCKDRGLTKPYDLSKFTREEVDHLFNMLEWGIDGEIFLPNPGSRCNVCPVWQWCRAKGPDAEKYKGRTRKERSGVSP